MTTRPTTLFDRVTRTLAVATIRCDLTVAEILAVEAVWGPARRTALERLAQRELPDDEIPQHWHWDWAVKIPKLRLPGYRGVGVECEGVMQGLMLLASSNHASRLSPNAGSPLVYVDYLESAPWNVRVMTETPRYGGVGTKLIVAAVRLSIAEEFSGRVGLHSLPQAEAFYERTCGMTRVGIDPDYESLSYFEFTSVQAADFLEREDSL